MRDAVERGQTPRKAGRFGVRQLGMGIVCAQGADCRRRRDTPLRLGGTPRPTGEAALLPLLTMA